MKSKPLFRFFALFALLIGLTACMSLAEDITPPPGYQAPTAQQSTPTSETPIYPMLPPDPARGTPLYAEKCAPCHGISGLGDGPDAGMLSNPVAALGDPALARLAAPDDWYLMVTNGNMQNFMPPFASLTVPERWDVIAHAYTLSTTPAEVARGQELYVENCAACHGERGQGDGPEAGSLSASPIDFTDQEFMGARSAADLYNSITEGLGEMHSFADLSETDRWALTAFLRTLTFAEPTPEGDLTETPEAYPGPEPYPVPEATSETPVETTPEGEIEPEVGTVSVTVISTSGVEIPSNMEVTIFGFEGMTQVFSHTLPLSDDGIAVLEDVPMPPEQFIFATAEYNDLVYGSEIAVVDPGTTSVDLEISYYERTSDLSVLRAERLHVIFGFENEETVQVYVLYIFSNTSEQVLAGENPDEPAVTFTLPEGAFNLQRDTGMEFQDIDTPDGFGIFAVYPRPEPYQILYSFDLPYEKEKVDFDIQIAMNTTAMIVMAPENGVKIKSDQLTDAGMRDIEGISYNIYNGSSLQADDLLSMSVSGRPKATTTTDETEVGDNATGLVIGLVAFGVMLIAAGVYLWQRNRTEEADWGEDRGDLDSGLALESPEDLMDAIIALDELYKDGEIPEDAYQKRRAELKERLRELVE
jgi:mono/diheme cytochrome c family protein